MRILAVTNLYPNPIQPNRATFNRQQFEAISAAGCPMRVISPIAWTDELAARRAGRWGATSRTSGAIEVEHPRYLFPPKVLRSWYGQFFLRSIRRSFEQAVREFRPDVVLASWAYPDGWAAVRLAREAGRPVVVKVHGSDVLLLAKSGMRRRLTADALRQADGVIAVSRDLVNKVIELGMDASRVRLIYNGVDTKLFCPGDRREARCEVDAEPDAKLVLFAGNLVEVKAIDVLLDAFASVARTHAGAVCRIVGQGPLRASLEQRAKTLGIGDRVRFVGSQPHHKLPAWFRAADVFVLPSRSEGVPNVLLEAAACGTPFVASRVGGIPEIAELGVGQLVTPGDSAALAAAIKELLSTSAIASRTQRTFRSHADSAADVIGFLQASAAACRERSPAAEASMRSMSIRRPAATDVAVAQPA